MNYIKSHRLIIIWLFIGIPLISYFLLKKTFNLALYGDDWLQLYNLWVSFDIRKELSFFDIKSYLGAYWPQYFFLGLIRHFFEYQASAYFAASLMLKVLATISLFFLIKILTKSSYAGFLATIILTFSVAGIQTTDWVFNMNTYAGIFLINLAFVFYFKIREQKSFILRHYIIFSVFFILALGVVPVRMHGAVPLLIATELFYYLFIDKKSIFKFDSLLIIRLTLPIILMFILIRIGSFGNEGDILLQLQQSFNYMQNMAQKGRYDVLFYFLGIIGNIAIPDTLNLGNMFTHTLPRFLFFTTFSLLISFATHAKRTMYIWIVLLNIILAIVSKLIIHWNPLLSFNNIFSISAGFQLLFVSFLIYFDKRIFLPRIAGSIIFGILWIIFFSILYWLRTPYLIIETTGRYMTLGAVGFAIVFAGINKLIYSNSKDKINSSSLLISFLLLLVWSSINYKELQTYLTYLETNRNIKLAEKTWISLKEAVPVLDSNSPSIFYFTYDNSTAANMILIFGFPPHAGLSYGIPKWEKTPIPTENYTQLLDMARTGESMKIIHAREAKPVPLEKIFSFDLREGELINTTSLIRQQLAKDLSIPIPTQ